MNQREMLDEFLRHCDAEIRRDYDAIIDTFVEDCYIETVALGLRADGREATRTAYVAYFTAFPDLESEYQGYDGRDNVLVGWGVLRGTSRGEWLGIPPTGRSFAMGFANVATFRDGQMAGETIYYDVATLCRQAGFSIDEVMATAKARAAS